MLISLCMIVRDEEKVLGRCLDSVQGLADEIIIVDTGSVDRTKEIAKQYTHHVYEFEWINDFASARNESLRHASGDWILVMDADEYVEAGQQDLLRKRLAEIRTDKPKCLLVKIMNFHGDRGQQVYESTGARIFLNRKGIHYEEPIHEQLVCPQAKIEFAYDSFTLYHSGYMPETVREKDKNRRNMDILRRMESEDKLRDPYFCFVIGNEYSNSGDVEKAYGYYKKAIDRVDRSSNWYEHLLERFCQTAQQTEHFREAHLYIQQGKRQWPNRADYYCLEGMLFEGLGFYQEAMRLYQQCLHIAESCQGRGEPYWVIQEEYGINKPHQKLAEIAGKRGDLKQMVYHLTSLLKLDRQNFAALRTLLRTLAAYDSTSNVHAFMDKLYPVSEPKNAYIMLQVTLLEGLRELAAVYWNACQEQRVPLNQSDELSYSLLQKKEAKPERDQQIAPHLALTASVVYRDSRFTALAVSHNALLDKLSRHLLETGTGEQDSQPRSPDEYALLTQLIVQLLQFGYTDEYERLVNRLADEELLHELAEQLHTHGYVEIAIELYSILLANDLLRGEGYEQLGSYCFMNGNPQNGLQFMETAVQMSPRYGMLGLVLENSKGLDITEFNQLFAKKVDLGEVPEPIIKMLSL